MDYQTITCTEEGGIGIVTLNRPEVMNALNSVMRTEIRAAFEALAQTARVIVLTGAGRAFCSGQDLASVGDPSKLDFEGVLKGEYEPMLAAITGCPVPTIAAVNGAAAGAGANLALGCDVVIASESAVFLQAFTRIGLMPDAGGTHWLPRQVGFARAMGAMLFAEGVPARKAADWGMIWEAVPEPQFEAVWRARAAQLAAGPGVAYRGIKQALRAASDLSLDEQLALEARLQGECGRTGDFLEGVAAFLQKRAPAFKGR